MTPTPADTRAGISVAILAGGLGTRLRAVVADRPKVLAEVNGRPFLAWLLENLVRAGFKQVVLCTGHLSQEIERTFGRHYEGLSIIHSHERAPLGTGGALRLALPFLQSRRILTLNGDSFCTVDFPSFNAAHASRRARASLALAWVEDARRFGSVLLQDDGRITQFSEKESSFGSGWVNAGVYLFERELIEALPANLALSLEREVFPMWIPQGFYGFKTTGRFVDIGTPESLAAANQESFREPVPLVCNL